MTEILFNLALAAAMLWLAMAPLPRGHRCHRRDDP